MEKLKEILTQSIKRLDLTDKLSDYGIWPIWNETVGPTVARNAQPEKIHNGTLFVKVTSSTWMQQLQFMKEMITEKINERMGRETVKNIFFVVGTVHYEEPQADEHPSKEQPASRVTAKLDEKELTSINDPAIRESLQRLYDALSRRRRP